MVNEESKTTQEDIQLVEAAWLEVTWCHALHLWPFSLTEKTPGIPLGLWLFSFTKIIPGSH
jgi:hypothetical protein